MRKALLSILLVLILALMILFVKNGIHIGSFQVYGLKSINQKNTELTQTISSANAESSRYEGALQKLQTDVEQLTKAKKDYLDLVAQSTENEIRQATQTKIYTIEYLWSRVGNHAASQGVTITMEFTGSTLGNSDYRNLNFTVNGEYLAITQFITELENDANLDFIIDNFSMTANEAKFVVKDVRIQKEKTTVSDTNETDGTNDTDSQPEQTTEPEVTINDDGSKTKVLGQNS